MRCMVRFGVVAASLLCTLALASRAKAVVLAPGDSFPISGTFAFGAGTVIADPIRPVLLTDGTQIEVQDRVVRDASGHLYFGRQLRNTSNNTYYINHIDVGGFAGFSTDGDWDNTSLGFAQANGVTRSGAPGNVITLENFNPNNLNPAGSSGGSDLSRFMYVKTDAYNYDQVGFTNIYLMEVTGAPVTGELKTFAPVVPEPASLGLLTLGICALMLRRRA